MEKEILEIKRNLLEEHLKKIQDEVRIHYKKKVKENLDILKRAEISKYKLKIKPIVKEYTNGEFCYKFTFSPAVYDENKVKVYKAEFKNRVIHKYTLLKLEELSLKETEELTSFIEKAKDYFPIEQLVERDVKSKVLKLLKKKRLATSKLTKTEKLALQIGKLLNLAIKTELDEGALVFSTRDSKTIVILVPPTFSVNTPMLRDELNLTQSKIRELESMLEAHLEDGI